ncbi:MAG: hypothetical protein QW478_13650, partial [Candidatus Micrarchaeaceae archaeon]
KGNTVFEKGYLKLGNKIETRNYNNPSQSKKLAQTLAVMNTIKRQIEQGKTITLRDLFYMLKVKVGEDIDEKIFDEQNESNSVAVDLELITGYSREQLHLITNPRAFAVGNIIAEETFRGKKETIDFSKGGSAGVPVAPDPEVYTFKKVNVKFILFIEKYAVFQKLNEEDFPTKYNALILTSSGYPSRSSRLMVKKLHNDYKLPVYILTDADPDGYNIATTLQVGSMALAWLSEKMAVTDGKFLGLKLSDIENNKDLKYIKDKHLVMPVTKRDLKKIDIMLKYPWIQGSEYEKELKLMKEQKLKVESDVLAAKEYQILEDYILHNIKTKNWIEIGKTDN